MTVVQLCQILFVALIGAFALLVAYNNVHDPQSNLRLVEHVLGAGADEFHAAKGVAFAGLGFHSAIGIAFVVLLHRA